MKLASSARSASFGSPADQSVRCVGRCAWSVARARCSALFTAATLVSSAAAVSAAGQPRTSRAMSVARWRGGQHLERGEERELDGLAGDDDRLGLVVARRDLVEQSVRVRA